MLAKNKIDITETSALSTSKLINVTQQQQQKFWFRIALHSSVLWMKYFTLGFVLPLKNNGTIPMLCHTLDVFRMSL